MDVAAWRMLKVISHAMEASCPSHQGTRLLSIARCYDNAAEAGTLKRRLFRIGFAMGGVSRVCLRYVLERDARFGKRTYAICDRTIRVAYILIHVV